MTDETVTRDDRADTREETGRRQRIPMGVPRAKLHAEIDKGYVGRWINDHNGRIQQAEAAGYTHVTEGKGRGNKRRQQVGTLPDGSPMFAYLMQIRKEFYDEDQALKLRAADDIDAAIKRGTPREAEGQDAANFYGKGTLAAQ